MRAVAWRDRVQVFLEPDLLGCVLHLQRGQPTQVCGRPTGLAGVGDAVAQQQGLEPMARVAAFAHRVLAGSHEVAHGLVAGTGHAHCGEVTGSRQARQHHGVAPVGLDAVCRAAGNRRGCHHFAWDTQCGQMPPDDEPARAGFVNNVQRMPLAGELAQRLVQRDEVAADAAHMPHLAVTAGLGSGDVDTVFVNVQSDVHGARFVHGSSPRKFATT